MLTSLGSTGSGRGGGRGDAKTILSPNTSFGDIIRSGLSQFELVRIASLVSRKLYLVISCPTHIDQI